MTVGGLLLVTVPYWWHATLLEGMWLAAGLASLPVAVSNLLDAKKDEAILDDIRNDPTVHSRHYFMIEEAAKGHTFQSWLSVLAGLFITAAGVVAVATANPLGGRTTATGFAVTICLVGLAGVSATRSYSSMVRRQRLYELAAGRSAVLAAEMRVKNVQPEED